MVLAQEVVLVCLCLKDTEIHAASKQGNTTNSALESLHSLHRLTKITGRREAWDLGRQITGVSKLCQRYGPWDDGGICVVRGRRA